MPDSLNMDYSQLLKRAQTSLPEVVSLRQRFEIPKVMGHLQGNKTVINNFMPIVSGFHREPAHMLKYLLKELATAGELRNNLVLFNRKIPSTEINNKIRQYAQEFVLCSECGKPDTRIINENNVTFLKCQACGAKSHINM